MTNPKPRRIVTAPLLTSAYPKAHWARDRKCLTHACEIADDGAVKSVLCFKVKPQSITADTTQHTQDTPTCRECVQALAKINLRKVL